MSLLRGFALYLFVTFMIISVFSGSAYAGGFAISPAELYFNKVLRDGYAEQQINLYNPEEIITDIEISIEGPFVSWLYFDSGKKLSIENESSRNIKLFIVPPADIANGIYNGTINLVSKPRRIPSSEGHSISIETAIALKVFIEITGEQVVGYEIQNIATKNVEEGQSIPFSFTGINRGNVKVSPRVLIDIYNWDRSTLIKSNDFQLDETLPTAKKTYSVNVSSYNLVEGQYWANVSIYVNNEEISTKLITFDILKKGSLRRNGELLQVKTSNIWPNVGELIRVEAVFKNTGQISTTSKFKGEVYINDILVETLESEELEVPIASTVTLTAYYTPKREGRYEIKGSVYYSGKMTYEKGTIINVMPDNTLSKKADIFNNQYLLPTFLFMLLMAYIWYQNKNSGAKEYGLKSVSGKFNSVESNLENLMKKSSRMTKKIQRLKTRYR